MYELDELIGDAEFFRRFRSSLELKEPPPVLREAKIKLTSFCNLRCEMCRYWKITKQALSRRS